MTSTDKPTWNDVVNVGRQCFEWNRLTRCREINIEIEEESTQPPQFVWWQKQCFERILPVTAMLAASGTILGFFVGLRRSFLSSSIHQN
jgi:hypothetical protein